MLAAIEEKTIESMWLEDIEVFETQYIKYLKDRMKELDNKEDTKTKKKQNYNLDLTIILPI